LGKYLSSSTETLLRETRVNWDFVLDEIDEIDEIDEKIK
jgi:hypothetical protein